jgi:hypothetical protein
MTKKLTDLERARKQENNKGPIKIDPCNVASVQCASCPWKQDGGILGQDTELKAALEIQVATQENQLCHAPALVGEPETQICRGARDYQLQIFYRLGVLEAETDEAWAKALGRL